VFEGDFWGKSVAEFSHSLGQKQTVNFPTTNRDLLSANSVAKSALTPLYFLSQPFLSGAGKGLDPCLAHQSFRSGEPVLAIEQLLRWVDAGVGGALSGLVLLKAVLDVFRDAGVVAAAAAAQDVNRPTPFTLGT